MQERVVYPPLDTLKPVAPDVWIVDSGPIRPMGLPIPVRMTVVRLGNGDLWLHSPTTYSEDLRKALEGIGPIKHLVAPNIAHWTFLKDWRAHCPGAATWAAPGLRNRLPVKTSGVVLDHDLTSAAPEAWADDIDQVVVPGALEVNEVAFHHRASRTLILTDLIENLEPEKVPFWMQPLVWLAGAMAPDGKAPAHVRLAFTSNKAAAAAAMRQCVEWQPERVVFAHGRWFESDGTAQLKRSLRWLLG